MVKVRGIQVNVVSQIEARRLEEYESPQSSNGANHVASCYLPIIPGAHIWFEYSIDGPHPPGAIYLFKLFVNGQVVANWDCTARHDYHGKTVYVLRNIQHGKHGERAIIQQSFSFSLSSKTPTMQSESSSKISDDVVEMKVHRVQYRRRIWQPEIDRLIKCSAGSAIRLIENGLIERSRPAKKYQYQLVDPLDKPYAIFRFVCKTKDWIAASQLQKERQPFTPLVKIIGRCESPQRLKNTIIESVPTTSNEHGTSHSCDPTDSRDSPISRSTLDRLSPSHSYGSLSTIARDSLELTPADTVTRSPDRNKGGDWMRIMNSTALYPHRNLLPPSPSPSSLSSLSSISKLSSARVASPLLPSPPSARLTYQRHKRHNNSNDKTLPLTPVELSSIKAPKRTSSLLAPIELSPINLNADQGIAKGQNSQAHTKMSVLTRSGLSTASSVDVSARPISRSSHRSLSPFTPSGLLRHLLPKRSPKHKRPATPALPSTKPLPPHLPCQEAFPLGPFSTISADMHFAIQDEVVAFLRREEEEHVQNRRMTGRKRCAPTNSLPDRSAETHGMSLKGMFSNKTSRNARM